MGFSLLKLALPSWLAQATATLPDKLSQSERDGAQHTYQALNLWAKTDPDHTFSKNEVANRLLPSTFDQKTKQFIPGFWKGFSLFLREVAEGKQCVAIADDLQALMDEEKLLPADQRKTLRRMVDREEFCSPQKKAYQELSAAFRGKDIDKNARLSSNESSEDVKQFDENQSGTVEIWELMKAKNAEQVVKGGAALFPQKLIEQFQQGYSIVSRVMLERSETLTAIEAVSSLRKSGLPAEQIRLLLNGVARHVTVGREPVFKSLPHAVVALRKAGLPPEDWNPFLIRVAERASSYATAEANEGLYDAVMALQEAGLQGHPALDFIDRLMGQLKDTSIESDLYVGRSIKHLPELLRSGLTPNESANLMVSVAKRFSLFEQNTPDLTYLAKAFQTLKSMGVSTGDAITFLPEVVSANQWETEEDPFKILIQLLPTLHAAGYTPEQCMGLLKALARRIETLFPVAIKNLPPVVEALRKVGLDTIQIALFLVRVAELRRDKANWIFGSLPSVVTGLAALGYSGREIDSLLSDLVSKGSGLNSQDILENAPAALQSLLDLGENKISAWSSVVLLADEVQYDSSEVFLPLPTAVTALRTLGLPKEEIGSLLHNLAKKIGSKTGLGTGLAFQHLPGAIEALRQAGFSRTEVVDHLKSSADLLFGMTGRYFEMLPLAKNSGMDPRTFRNSFRKISSICEHNDSCQLESLAPAFQALLQQGTPPEQAMEHLLKVAKGDPGHTLEAFFVIPGLLADRFSLDQVVSLLSSIRRNARTVSGEIYALLRPAGKALMAKGIPLNKIVSFLNEGTGSEKGDLIRVLRMMPDLAVHASQDRFEDFQKGVHILFQATRNDPWTLTQVGGPLRLNLSNIRDRASLGREIAAGIDQFYRATKNYPQIRDLSPHIAVLINHLHDQDGPDDLIRKTIVQNLSVMSIYLLCSLGGADLYTSTYVDRIYAMRIENDRNFIPEIRRLDPQGWYMLGFILTAASFHRFWNIFEHDSDYFAEQFQLLIFTENEEGLARNVSLLLSTVSQFIRSRQHTALRKKFEAQWLDTYRQAVKREDRLRQGVFGYFIKLHADDFLAGNREEAKQIASFLPPVLLPRVPDAWLADRKLKAKFYFYEDETNHFRLIQSMYRARGFHVAAAPSRKTVTMTKMVNSILLEVVATQEGEDIEKTMQDPSIDIVAHRGHSFHLNETFGYCESNCRNQRKLLYLGSCGSFRTVPDLMKMYQGNYFMSDEDTGRGQDNNNVLYGVMESIALGERDWDRIRERVSSVYRADQRGILFPTDRALVLYDFIEVVRQM